MWLMNVELKIIEDIPEFSELPHFLDGWTGLNLIEKCLTCLRKIFI